jgi:hypothetical protein
MRAILRRAILIAATMPMAVPAARAADAARYNPSR